jgi:tetratricopeptide (TPR) repeat protein
LVRGDLKEGFDWVERALALRGGDPDLRARACLGGSYVGLRAGEVQRAKQLADEGIALYRALGDARGAAHALRDLGNALIALEEFDRARALYEESATLSRDLDDAWNLAIAMNNLGYTALCVGDFERAREACDESRALRREVGDSRGEVLSLANRSLAALASGQVAEASHGLTESIRLARELNFHEGLSEALVGLAAVAVLDRNAERAARVLGTLEALTDHHGFAVTVWPFERVLYERVVADATERLGQRRFNEARAEGRAAPIDDILDDLLAALLSS